MIRHILRNGTVLQDIKGHVVKREDVPEIYEIRERMNKEEKNGDQV